MTIFEQIGNIGSEITRARVWEEKSDTISRNKALARALGLIDIILSSNTNTAQQRELNCLREAVLALPTRDNDCLTKLRELENYCLPFALLARKEGER